MELEDIGHEWHGVTDKTKIANSDKAPSPGKRLLIRGSIFIIASCVIAWLIMTGIAEPHPNLKFAYFGCIAACTWGLIDLVRGLFELSSS